MMENSVRTRGVRFAYLFGPPRFVTRGDAVGIHDAVCKALGYDDLAFRYSPSEPPRERRASKGFTINFDRKEGRGAFAILLDYHPGGQTAMRLLMDHTWPPSGEHVKQQVDQAADAVFSSLQGNWQKVVAEVRLRAECDVRENDALVFIRESFLKLDRSRVEGLGRPLAFASLRLEVGQSAPVQGDPLGGPAREITIEVLRDDPRTLYVELMSQWSQVSAASEADGALELRSLRPFDNCPSEYFQEAHDFLVERVLTLTCETGAANA